MLTAPPDPIRAAQALSILAALEQLPAGRAVILARLPGAGWQAWISGRQEHRGETATDALGQLTTVLALEGPL